MKLYKVSDTFHKMAEYQSLSENAAEIWDDDETGNNYYPPCPGVEEHGPNWHPEESLTVKLHRGELADFLWLPNSFAVKVEVSRQLTERGIFGFDSRPVTVTNPGGRKRLDASGVQYTHLFVTGSAHLDHRKCHVKLLYECRICGAKRYSGWGGLIRKKLQLAAGTYDGSDLFRIKEHEGLIFCSERFLEGAKACGWTNLSILDAALVDPPILNDISYDKPFKRWKYRK